MGTLQIRSSTCTLLLHHFQYEENLWRLRRKINAMGKVSLALLISAASLLFLPCLRAQEGQSEHRSSKNHIDQLIEYGNNEFDTRPQTERMLEKDRGNTGTDRTWGTWGSGTNGTWGYPTWGTGTNGTWGTGGSGTNGTWGTWGSGTNGTWGTWGMRSEESSFEESFFEESSF